MLVESEPVDDETDPDQPFVDHQQAVCEAEVEFETEIQEQDNDDVNHQWDQAVVHEVDSNRMEFYVIYIVDILQRRPKERERSLTGRNVQDAIVLKRKSAIDD